MSAVKVLLVDDLDENLRALEGVLRREGLEILKARSGPEALELLLVHDVALAFLDVQMPHMSGFELAELMRGTERTRRIPIIFVTAGGSDSYRVFRGYEAGAVDFLAKPLDPHVLRSKAGVFFELHRQQREVSRLLEESERNAARLGEALVARDEFLAVAGHELRTPLASLLMHVEGLERTARQDAWAPRASERLNKAARAGRRLEQLVDELLDVSRMSAGRMKLEPEQVDLSELAREVCARFAEQAERAHTHIELVVKPHLIGTWDRARLEQVIANLLSNAVKYGKGSPVHIELREESGWAVLRVRDRGIGIEPEEQARIFERFERAVATREYGGLGLGLWIASQIVQASGGTIGVTSQPGDGATFTVRLPMVQQADVHVRP